jgi:delta-aminolevulinic acid dehydratase/porphobilinogen synthase
MRDARQACSQPQYSDSSGLKAAARNGWIDEQRAMMECLTSIRRAGTDVIITNFARHAARIIS